MLYSKIVGTGMYVPKNIVSNDDLSKFVDTNHEWIVTRTGIEERRISTGEETSDIAYEAAYEALESSSLKAEDLDYIIVATLSGEVVCPSIACIVQKRLNAKNATAFDINAACTGFIYGVTLADSLIKSGSCKNALVIGAEVLSKVMNWEDRNTCVLFGDGAGAAVLSASENQGIICSKTKSFGDIGDCLKVGGKELDNPFAHKKNSIMPYISMEGKEVFRFATGVMVELVEKVVKESGINLEEVAMIVPHQANLRIIDYAARKLKVSLDKFYINLNKYGNTSAASVPIALDEAVKFGKIKKGDYIILVGFGGGLTCGATLIKY